MKAIVINAYGGPEVLSLSDFPTPKPGPEEILVEVAATALNRADILQRQGKYPPPPGVSPVPGLEIAGVVVSAGSAVTRWSTGDRVCGLLAGGGYAQYAVIHQDIAMPVPATLGFEQAAAIPEVFLTAFQALDWLAAIQPGESVLIHAGGSGVGTAAIQIAREKGARIFATASLSKHPACLRLGAEKVIDYQSESFVSVIQDVTGGSGVNVILDFLAAPCFQQNINALATDGRLVMLALMGGPVAEKINLAPILTRRLKIMGSTLRNRSEDYKIALNKAFSSFALPLFESGQLVPVIDTVFDWEDIQHAHIRMETNQNTGKIVLRVANL
ncbi:MAG: NAD(P)H-quinone oxidoreductase [Bacteroidia bacterium]